MSLKWRYWISIGLLHSVLAFLVYQLLFESALFFILGEVFLLVSLAFSYSVYRRLIAPVEFISAGVDAIKSEDFQVKYLHVGSKEMDQLIDTYNKMIDHLRSERVKNSEQHFFLEKLIDKIPTGIILLDFDGEISLVNPAARLFLDQVLKEGHTWIEFQDIPVHESKVVTIGSARKFKVESSSFLHMGFKRQFFIIHDLTSELLRSEKESYGKVIRMMAHEVNNTIGPVNSIMDSAMEYLNGERDQPFHEGLQIARERNDQLNTFMKNFADLVRLPRPALVRYDISTICREVATLYRPLLKDNDISLEVMIKEEAFVDIDPVLIRQVCINILKNAIEAVIESGRDDGQVIVSLRKQDNSVWLEIKDNGVGLDPAIEDQVFTPFFSTKQHGQGIGLTLIRDILINHGVAFKLHSQDGWTSFEILFQESESAESP